MAKKKSFILQGGRNRSAINAEIGVGGRMISQPQLETISPGCEGGQLRLVAEEVLPELPHGRQHLVASLALVQLLLPAEPLSLRTRCPKGDLRNVRE